MAEYGRDWSHRRGERAGRRRTQYGRLGYGARSGYGGEFGEEFGGGGTRRRIRRRFTDFGREPGVEEGFGYGAGVGYGMEMEYGPEGEYRPRRGYRTRRGYRGGQGYEIERGYAGGGYGGWFDYGERQLPEYGYDYEYGGRGWPYRGRRFRGGRPLQRRGFAGYERGFEEFGRGGGYPEEFSREEGFGPSYRFERRPRYGHTPEDRWPGSGHDVDNLDRDELEMDDDEVREAVLENLFQDSWIDPERIDVEVDRGVVTLTGEVRDFMEARYAWDDAWESAGVRGVINNLTVRADLPQEGMELPQTSGEQEGGRGRR